MTRLAFIAFAICAVSVQLAACAGAQVPDQQPADVPPPVAKSGPSFSQTRDFIIAGLSGYGGFDTGSWRQEISDVHVDNWCRLSFVVKNYLNTDGFAVNESSSGTVTIPIGAVTAVDETKFLNPSNQGIEFYTGNADAISMQTLDGAPASASASHVIYISSTPQSRLGQEVPDSDEDMRIRLRKAFSHLVDMCKGRYVSKPEQPQPF